jgi:RNA polymerase sigma factor (sigma-70 family)
VQKTEREKIIESNLKLVDFVCHKIQIDYGKNGVEYNDLQSIGRIGLIKAVDRFNFSSGNKFSSFAVPYIKGEIQHFLRDKAAIVRGKRGETPIPVSSLDRKVAEDGSELVELIADNSQSKEKEFEVSDELKSLLRQLKPQQRDVVMMRSINGLTQNQTAEWLEVSPMTVHRWHETALADLKELAEKEPNKKSKRYKRKRAVLPYCDELGLHLPFKHKCEVCARIFGLWECRNRTPKTCSSFCARKKADEGSVLKVWSEKELDFCINLIGTLPLPEIYEKLKERNTRLALPVRSMVSVKVKLTRACKTVKASQDNLNGGELARQLGISRDRVRHWLKVGLSGRKIGRRWMISVQDLHAFILNNMHLFTGINPEKLGSLINDTQLAQKCDKLPNQVRRIECFDKTTKTLYRSKRAASIATGLPRQSVLSGCVQPSTYVCHSYEGRQAPSLDQLRTETRLFVNRLKHGKVWRFLSPEGVVYETDNLNLFSRVHSLHQSGLHCVWEGKKTHCKGWRRAE